MDVRHFDALAKTLASPNSRRRLLTLLAALPLVGGLLTLAVDTDVTVAKDRRRRRKQRHKRRKHPGTRKGKRKQPCKPESVAQTCAGTCGSITNNCKQTIDCGSCDCPAPCGACLTCQSGPNTTGTCVPDPAQNGDACDDSDLCTTGSVCTNGVCGGGAPVVCPATDCQIPGVCDPATGTCTDAGFKDAGTACASQPCGACNGTGTCVANSTCSGTTPVCVSGSCAVCTADPTGCPGATCCDGDTGTCVAACPASDPICGSDNLCGTCTSHTQCGTNALCVDEVCQPCDVLSGENLATAIGGAQDGETLYVCAGRYNGNITITTNVTLIGAGDGLDDTIIEGGSDVLEILAGTVSQPVTLRGLRIRDGGHGIMIGGGRHLTMTDCTVSGNNSSNQGAGVVNLGGTLQMTGCTIENNTAGSGDHGGGLYNTNGPATLTDCLVRGNSAFQGGGIYNLNTGATMTLRGTRVTSNTAVSSGSGIYNLGNNGSTVTLLEGSTVCANNPTTNQCRSVTDPDGGCQET